MAKKTNKHKAQHDYTKSQPIQDAERSYQEKVKNSRGFNNSKNTSTTLADLTVPILNTDKQGNVEDPGKKQSDTKKHNDHSKSTSETGKHVSEHTFSQLGRNDRYPESEPTSQSANRSYDYTKSQTVADAQQSYDNKTMLQRGIQTRSTEGNLPGSKIVPPHNHSKIDGDRGVLQQDTTEQQRNNSIVNLAQNGHIPPIFDAKSYDYTKSQSIQDAERTFQTKVNKQRGVLKDKQTDKTAQYSDLDENLNHSKIDVPKANGLLPKRDTVEDNHKNDATSTNRRISMLAGNKSPLDSKSYDYTKSQPVQDAEAVYQNRVNGQRGIPNVKLGEHTVTNPINSHTRYTNDDTHREKIYNPRFHDRNRASSDIASEKPMNSGQAFTVANKKKPMYVSRVNIWRGVEKEDIRQRGIDLSEIYEKSSRGGEGASELAREFSASETDLRDLLETRGLRPITGRRYKITNQVRKTTDILGTYMYEQSSAGSDARQGIRMTTEILAPAAFALSDRAQIIMVNAMKKNIALRLNQRAEMHNVFGNDSVLLKNPELGMTRQELTIMQDELIRKLKAAGHNSFTGDGVLMQNKITSYLRKNRKNLTQTEKDALIMLHDIAKIKTLDDSITRGRKRQAKYLRVKVMRYFQQSDAGLGMVFTYNMIRRSAQTLKLGLKLTRTLIKNTQIAGKLALLGSAKLAAKAAKTKLAEKLLQTKSGNRISSGISTLQNSVAKKKNDYINKKEVLRQSRMGRMANALQERHSAFRQFRKDPFSLKARRTNLLQKMKKTKIGRAAGKIFSPIEFVKRSLGYFTAGLMAVASTLISVGMIIIGFFFIALVVVSLITAIISAIAGLFDFSVTEEEIREAAFKTIKEQYESQNNQIQSLYDQYRTVTVNYEAIRDEAEYQKEEHQPATSFVQTTNSAELLSMAVVYFDFDLENAGKNKVCDYIRKLYNGSHQITLVEHPYTYKDERGNEYTIIDANVTLTTYYFNSLFECQLTDNAGITGSGGGILAGTQISEQVWNYFRSAGFTEQATAGIMGNMYQESGMNPASIQGGGRGPAAGICQWENYNTKSGRWKSLDNYAKGRGKPWTDLKCQLDFLLSELPAQFRQYTGKTHTYPNGTVTWWPEKMSVEQFKSLTDISKATEIFERVFERASKPNMARRINQANAYFQMYHGREVVTENNRMTE